LIAGPLALATAVAVVAFTSVQSGLTFASEALGIHWSRLNPATGVKRLFGRLGLDLVKMLILVAVLGWLSWRVVSGTLTESSAYARMAPANAAAVGWSHLTELLRHSVVALAVVGGADYLAQRWRLERSLRMTKQEVRDDQRMSEGNPEIKARVRRLQREVARRRMLASVPKATVVITNPTHYAVALEYRRDEMPAPRVLAKGKDALAARIREIARQHEIPIVENVPLARSLYRGVEVDEFIPAELFGAVAEVLAYLIKLKQLAR
jgi:flagellar biosynthesis protein FlhB